MKIIVTKQNIKDGIKGDSRNCPVALAIKKEYPICDVSAAEDYIYLGDYEYKVPRSVQRFITKFDKVKSSVKPFCFILKNFILKSK